MNEPLQAIVTVLSLVNPAICAMMFAQATVGRPFARKFTDATRAAFAILIILAIAALVGTRALRLFNVSLDAFMVAGGAVLAWMGFSMLSRKPEAPAADQSPKGANQGTQDTSSLTPLIMFAASPGTITGVITLSAAHTRLRLPITALVAIAVATTVTWLIMLLVARFGGQQGGTSFVRDTATRFMGLLVLSMGVQFALTGLHTFWAGASPSPSPRTVDSASQPSTHSANAERSLSRAGMAVHAPRAPDS